MRLACFELTTEHLTVTVAELSISLLLVVVELA